MAVVFKGLFRLFRGVSASGSDIDKLFRGRHVHLRLQRDAGRSGEVLPVPGKLQIASDMKCLQQVLGNVWYGDLLAVRRLVVKRIQKPNS